MNTRRQCLAQRRERLISEAAQQRMALSGSIEELRPPLRLADQGVKALCYLRSHPQWIAGAVVLVATFSSRRSGVWLGRGWMAWQALQKLRER
ncbi:YqjK family protein [Nitrincola sp. MINF-07-Sa-05]|uniref:YqjK family protein n=1 Tax=Nitrincola salilacus TaxID=3400273 RepID=UPI003917BADA